jgi:hypothetical protein
LKGNVMGGLLSFAIRNKLLRNTTILLIALFPVLTVAQDDVIRSESVTESTITTNGKTETTLNSPPASAISPTINTSNSDLCTFGVAGAVQTQILGISTGTQFTDENCERLKNSKTLYDMGMKVAAVSLMCQDQRVFKAMMNAGTPCPYDGMIGDEAKAAWEAELAESNWQEHNRQMLKAGILDEQDIDTAVAAGGVGGLLALLLLL